MSTGEVHARDTRGESSNSCTSEFWQNAFIGVGVPNDSKDFRALLSATLARVTWAFNLEKGDPFSGIACTWLTFPASPGTLLASPVHSQSIANPSQASLKC